MNDVVVVTLVADKFCKDFELPSNVALGKLYPVVLSALQSISVKQFGDFDDMFFSQNGYVMADDAATLADYGIANGAILDIIQIAH